MKITKQMNISLWLLQILLALYFMAGGIYLAINYEKIASVWAFSVLSKPAWVILGALQVLLALGLVLPRAVRVLPRQIAISAVGLTAISLLGIVLYIEYARFPGILWAVVPAMLTAFVAHKRWR